jgi:hypothetical protein
MDRVRVPYPAVLLPIVVMMALTACSGGGGDGADGSPPFDMQTGVVATDLDGDGRVDVAVANRYIDGPPPHPGSVRVYLHEPSSPRGFRAATATTSARIRGTSPRPI